jgi:5,10-methylenetetrahydromethanopterin reductase
LALPLKFAIDLSPGSWSGAQRANDADRLRATVDRTIELGQIADRAGIAMISVLEDPDGWDAFAILGALARQTERVRLGTGVTNPYFRHPSLIAASLGTLDLLSDGRAFLGLGRGQGEWYAAGLGMPYGKPVAKLVETIDLLRQWFRPEMIAISPPDATEFGANAWRRAIRPVQAHLPIYLAAVGPKALRVAAGHADGVIFNDLASRGFIREAIATVREAAREAGRDPGSLEFHVRAAVTITDDPEAIWARRKDTVAMIHALPGMERLLHSEGFDVDRIIADVRQAMNTMAILERGGGFADLREGGDIKAARKAIPDDLMRELIVAGPVETVRARLREFADLGVTHVFLAAPAASDTTESIAARIEALSMPDAPATG